MNLKELGRGGFWGSFVTVLILKDLDRGAKGRGVCKDPMIGVSGEAAEVQRSATPLGGTAEESGAGAGGDEFMGHVTTEVN